MRSLLLVGLGAVSVLALACEFEEAQSADVVEETVVAEPTSVVAAARTEPVTQKVEAIYADERPALLTDGGVPVAPSEDSLSKDQTDLVSDRATFHAKVIERLTSADQRFLAMKRWLASADASVRERAAKTITDITAIRRDVDKEQLELALIPNEAWAASKERIDEKLSSLDAALKNGAAELGMPDGPSEL